MKQSVGQLTQITFEHHPCEDEVRSLPRFLCAELRDQSPLMAASPATHVVLCTVAMVAPGLSTPSGYKPYVGAVTRNVQGVLVMPVNGMVPAVTFLAVRSHRLIVVTWLSS